MNDLSTARRLLAAVLVLSLATPGALNAEMFASRSSGRLMAVPGLGLPMGGAGAPAAPAGAAPLADAALTAAGAAVPTGLPESAAAAVLAPAHVAGSDRAGTASSAALAPGLSPAAAAVSPAAAAPESPALAPAETAAPAAPASAEAEAEALAAAPAAEGTGLEARQASEAVFAGAAARPDLAEPAVAGAPSEAASGLAPARETTAAPRSGFGGWSFGAPPGPRSSPARSFRVGLLAATATFALTQAVVTVATVLGYHFHSNYHPLGGAGSGAPALGLALLFTAIATTLAPIAEEPVFRWGLMGGVGKLVGRLGAKAAFWIPAMVSSAIFVVVHETSDPVLIGVRMAGALIFAYTYKKEGLVASMATHAIFNLLVSLPLVFMAALGEGTGTIATMAAWSAALVTAGFAWRKIIAEKPERDAGTLVPQELKPGTAGLMAALLVAAFLLLMPNLYWLAGAGMLILYASSKKDR